MLGTSTLVPKKHLSFPHSVFKQPQMDHKCFKLESMFRRLCNHTHGQRLACSFEIFELLLSLDQKAQTQPWPCKLPVTPVKLPVATRVGEKKPVIISRKLRERVLLKNSCSIDHQHDKTIADHQPLTTANDKTIADHQPLTTANDKTIADHQPLTTANDETIADHQPLTTANDETIAEKKRSAVKIC